MSSQVHVLNASLNESTGLYEVRGEAWGQAGSIASVEVRVDGGSWMQATYETVDGGLGALERFAWAFAIDVGQLSKGNHTLEVRGLNEDGAPSLPVFVTFAGTGDASDGAGGLSEEALMALLGVVVLMILAVLAFGARIDPPLSLDEPHGADEEPLDAVLVENEAKATKKASKT